MSIEQRIKKLKIIPVVKIDNANDAVPLGRALIDGGLPAAEITFRTDAACETIGRLTAEFSELLVGAGTVLTIEQVNQAADAGAQFVVSPGFNPRIVDYCVNRSIPIFPGVNSPAGVEQGLERGLKVLKFFPAEASGGIAMIKAMAAPYAGIRFLATGGISAENIRGYLSLPAVLACGGSWMVKPELIHEGQFDEITTLTKEAVAAVGSIEIHR